MNSVQQFQNVNLITSYIYQFLLLLRNKQNDYNYCQYHIDKQYNNYIINNFEYYNSNYQQQINNKYIHIYITMTETSQQSISGTINRNNQQSLIRQLTTQLQILSNIYTQISLSLQILNSQHSHPSQHFQQQHQQKVNQTKKQQLKRYSQLILSKIKLQISKHQQAIIKINKKIMKNKALIDLQEYLSKDYLNVVKQANSLKFILQQCKLNNGRIPVIPKTNTGGGAQRLRGFQDQLSSQWQGRQVKQIRQGRQGRQIRENNTILQSSSGYTQTSQTQKNSLSQLAMQQLHKQFLTIRMISYKMYQNYTGHTHDDIHSQLQTTKQQQQKLKKQLDQSKQTKRQLINQQKQITKKLLQLKKCNQIIGRRYFVMGEREEDLNLGRSKSVFNNQREIQTEQVRY